ncbi:MAG: sulfatase, partial [Myxococcota bacterium]
LTHGAKESESRLPKEALLLSEHLKAEGFATGSFIANGYVSDRFGFDQGWDHYTNYIREGKSTEAEHVFGEAMEWIEGHQGERFFAYIQTIDPHVPYDPPAAYLRMYDDRHYDGQVRPRKTPELLEQAKRNPPQVTFSASDRRRLEALHDAEITQHDHHLGTFVNRMKELELWDNTLFVVVSDHGEEFGEHGSWGHGHSVYQELLHVPLFARLPDSIPAGRRIKDAVTTLDIPATVVDLLGVSPMPTEGESLMDLVDGIPSSRPRIAFSDFLHDRRVAVSGHWKFILRGNLTASMFDLRKDPQEVDQLDLNVHPIAQRFLRIHLGQYLGASDRANWIAAEQGPGIRVDQQAAEMDDAIRAQLRALGYAN